MIRGFVAVLVVLCLTGGVAWSTEVVDLVWDPPTSRVANMDCGQPGTPLTADEIASLEYTLSYRVKGTLSWTNVDTTAPTAAVSLTGYSTEYEFTVGARFPGGTILCATPTIEYTTGPDSSPPGTCSTLRANPR